MIAIMSTAAPKAAIWNEPALAHFSPSLCAVARELRRPAGAVLFRAGGRPTWMYFVRRGEAQMLRVTAAGAPVLLQRATGAFLAEASLTSVRYHCDAVCRTECDLLAFPLRALRESVDADQGTRWAWIGLLSSQSRGQRARIERLALKTVRERLQHLILAEGTQDGYALPGTRMDLAAELGVTPEALYRALASLQADGSLSLIGNRLRWRT
jgi:CRP/FNR family transcriptional regulator, dissimilatory nitrate respiration regulator